MQTNVMVFDMNGNRILDGARVKTASGVSRVVAKVGNTYCDGMQDWDGSPWVMFTNGSWMHSKDVAVA